MLSMFKDVRPYLVPKPKAEVPRPDNLVFKLHYKVTFAILAVASVLVSTYQYIDSKGSAIQCMFDKNVGIPQKIINRYCWIMSTFTLPKHYTGQSGEDRIYQGVGPHTEDDERVYHSYYQWVPLLLAVQAVMFYAPHWIWKATENNRFKNIICGLNKTLTNDDERNEKVAMLSDYMRARMANTGEHRSWARRFFLCECLNFVNVVGQIFLTDKFLGGEFTTYGTKVLEVVDLNPEDRVDPMSRVFPRMTKCIFHKYGGSGTIQKFDALCVLGMNIINEKVYIFLWFWFIALAVVTGVNLVLRALQYFMPNIRDRLVKLENLGYLDKTIPRADIDSVVGRLAYSDWLILYYLAQAMDKKNFAALISNLADNLPTYPYPYPEEDDEESHATPPPGYELEKARKDQDDGSDADRRSSGRSTLRSTNNFSKMLEKGIKSLT